MDRKEAVEGVANYLESLAASVPVGKTASAMSGQLAASQRLSKMAGSLRQSGDLFAVVAEHCRDKTAAVQHQIVAAIVRGFSKSAANQFRPPGAPMASPLATAGPLTAGAGRKFLQQQQRPAPKPQPPAPAMQTPAAALIPEGQPGMFRETLQNYPHFMARQFGMGG